jgi:hypothetical protein
MEVNGVRGAGGLGLPSGVRVSACHSIERRGEKGLTSGSFLPGRRARGGEEPGRARVNLLGPNWVPRAQQAFFLFLLYFYFYFYFLFLFYFYFLYSQIQFEFKF